MIYRRPVAALVATTALVAAGLMSTPVQADAADTVIAQLKDDGYTRIEIRRTPGRLFVDTERRGEDLDLVVDRRSGRLSRDCDPDPDGATWSASDDRSGSGRAARVAHDDDDDHYDGDDDDGDDDDGDESGDHDDDDD